MPRLSHLQGSSAPKDTSMAPLTGRSRANHDRGGLGSGRLPARPVVSLIDDKLTST